MLATVGYSSLDELTEAALPAAITGPLARAQRTHELPEARSEADALAALGDIASRNTPMRSMIGMGYYPTHTPAVIRRNILENPSWYTAYTPYQPEISQGRLEALLNFQTMVAELCGCEIANASLLDEATAVAEGVAMARRLVAGDVADRAACFVDADCHPQTIAVVRTRADPQSVEVIVGDPWRDLDPARVFAAVVSYPGSSGAVRSLAPVADAVRAAGAMTVAATDLLACCVLMPPGELGADIVVGNSQRFGVPMGFGGPHAAFLATSASHRRQLPGRLVGVSVDVAGRPAYRLALATREQHIRRDRATSNICTAQVLLAVVASAYGVYHGPDGLAAMARRVHGHAARLARALAALDGVTVVNEHFFDTLSVRVPSSRAPDVLAAAADAGILLRDAGDDLIGISTDETTTHTAIETVLEAFATALGTTPPGGSLASAGDDAGGDLGDGAHAEPDVPTELRVPPELVRTSAFMTHPTFHRYRSETELMRYLRRLASSDVALDRSMIPLGSCTMKLNAAAELTPITWSAFADLHPFAPLETATGYRQLIGDLERWLAACTGYDVASCQPNAGSQGELAGLWAIRAYHASRGEPQRDVCLIPQSAHGTNAASAVMAGMEVRVVACDHNGDVDVDDLRRVASAAGDRLAALMVTYPSTHGVFETQITAICDVVHSAGGQVYLDGANLNALLGLAEPGGFGADVSHLNLHKTFCIPHGGGGPGVGPVVARRHLAPFLPPSVADVFGDAGQRVEDGEASGAKPTISGAPFGSASILPISWMYITMMGAAGLRAATQHAILAANYVAARLAVHFDVLYAGKHGLVAHECVIDLRPLSKWASVEDVAKRLIDYGFHAPTMSFPVAGTLMVEPTESESLAEIDRFCDAMASIRGEIERVRTGEWPADDNPLINAPHTAAAVLADDWSHPYARAEAAYPMGEVADKYWPPVGRIDGAYGDRNLVCSCPPISAFAASG